MATIVLALGLSGPALAGTGDDRASVAGVGPPDAAAALRLAQLAFTRPSDKDFSTAQKAIERKIISLRHKMIAGEAGTAN